MFNVFLSSIIPTVHAQAFDFISNIDCVQSDAPSPGTCTIDEVTAAVGYLVNYGVAISGALALLMFVVGGWYLVASAGRKDWVARGKSILTNTVFAIFFILGAWLLVQGVLTIIGSNISLESGTAITNICEKPDTENGTPCGVNGLCKNRICVNPCAYRATATQDFNCRPAANCFPAGTDCAANAPRCIETPKLCPDNFFCCYPSDSMNNN